MSPSTLDRTFSYATNGINGSKIPAPEICQARAVQAYHSDSSQQRPGKVETEFLIVGAGPAGASLACFMASYGKQYIVVRLCRMLTR
jgi:pyruvate/2-oxoglutarate dehydrogenase complex dihydrolipoamide dehydrogenase (E3) component